jgi:hypothetical protein
METGQNTDTHRGRPAGHSGAREREDRILDLLKANPHGLTRNTLVDLLGGDVTGNTKQKVWLALDRLRDQGQVRTCAPVQVVAQVNGRTVKRGRQAIWALGPQCPQ